MISLQETMNKPPSDFFLGVVELDKTILVGILDDPIGLDLACVRLAFPIELTDKWSVEDVDQQVVVPERGVPDEIVVSGDVAIHSGGCPFGLSYFAALSELARIRPRRYKMTKATKEQIYKGAPVGTR
jgi:hypothetical protein